jgi:hypothetical protein
MISRQVCWRTMRWQNGQTQRSRNPNSEEVLQDCPTKWEESAAYSILARSSFSNKGRIHLRRPTCQFTFSLAAERRTIHSVWPVYGQMKIRRATNRFSIRP